nr:MAG TPA: hypothetical protein [Caudoviricetes sp.]
MNLMKPTMMVLLARLHLLTIPLIWILAILL